MPCLRKMHLLIFYGYQKWMGTTNGYCSCSFQLDRYLVKILLDNNTYFLNLLKEKW